MLPVGNWATLRSEECGRNAGWAVYQGKKKLGGAKKAARLLRIWKERIWCAEFRSSVSGQNGNLAMTSVRGAMFSQIWKSTRSEYLDLLQSYIIKSVVSCDQKKNVIR
jgi:hypothetical protein